MLEYNVELHGFFFSWYSRHLKGKGNYSPRYNKSFLPYTLFDMEIETFLIQMNRCWNKKGRVIPPPLLYLLNFLIFILRIFWIYGVFNLFVWYIGVNQFEILLFPLCQLNKVRLVVVLLFTQQIFFLSSLNFFIL